MIITNQTKKRKVKQDISTSKKNVEYYRKMIEQELDMQFILKETLNLLDQVDAMEKGGNK